MKRAPPAKFFKALLLTNLFMGSFLSAATFVVNDFGDEGDANPGDGVAETAPGNGITTLRAAIEEANAHPGPDLIRFSIAGILTPEMELPPLSDATGGTTIDGEGVIVLDGSRAGQFASGLNVTIANNVLERLQVAHFFSAVRIQGPAARGNVVRGCRIGTDGASALGNAVGISITSGASENRIGGPTPEDRNIISGNVYEGVGIGGAGTTGNLIQGNYVGLDSTGKKAISELASESLQRGVGIGNGAAGNVVGGTSHGERNVISGNLVGIEIRAEGTTGTLVLGNYVGTDDTGTTVVRNLSYGVWIDIDAAFNRVGGTEPGAGNLISGNFVGVELSLDYQLGTRGNLILGNIIGPDVTGHARLGNYLGVEVQSSRRGNRIGGTEPGARNIISGNEVQVGLEYSSNLVIQGNSIGGDIDGRPFLRDGPYGTGIVVQGSSSDNTIGGIEPGAGNLISGADFWGIRLTGNTCLRNQIRRNFIHGNLLRGISLSYGANGGILSPLITSINPIRGMAPAGSTVEVYVDDDGQGELYLASVEAGEDGTFSVMADLSSFPRKNVTATATDPAGNTSEFSAPFLASGAAGWNRYR